MIDIHCHILPGLDDGPKNDLDSIEMLRCAEKDGIKSIIATPHSFDGIYKISPETIEQSITALKKEIADSNISVNVLPGMEIHLCRGLHDILLQKQAITLNHSRYVLIELPAPFIPPQFKDVVFQLRLKGFYPILAHPERNMVVQKDSDIIYDFFEWGIYIQITAASVTGFFGGRIEKLCKKLLQNRLVHFIASDAHSIDNRPPKLSDAYEKAALILKNEEETNALFHKNPENVIADIPIDVCEPIRGKKFFHFFLKRKQK